MEGQHHKEKEKETSRAQPGIVQVTELRKFLWGEKHYQGGNNLGPNWGGRQRKRTRHDAQKKDLKTSCTCYGEL